MEFRCSSSWHLRRSSVNKFSYAKCFRKPISCLSIRTSISAPQAPNPAGLTSLCLECQGPICTGSRLRDLWRSGGNVFCKKMVEVSTPTHTHINISSLSTSTIDRSFLAGPPSRLKNVSAGVVGSPMQWYKNGVSDHCPKFWRISRPPIFRSLPPPHPAQSL